MDPDLLNTAQRRSLHASLKHFEKSLRFALYLIDAGEENGIFYHRSIHISPLRRELLRQKILKTLDELTEISETLGFDVTDENVEKIIQSEMNISWEGIEECRTKRLKGYGKLNPKAAAIIDPMIHRLSVAALELSSLVSTTQIHDETDSEQKPPRPE